MATDRQIAANRVNAQRSTGPKSAAGRARSSRNALKHGLSLSIDMDSFASAQRDALIAALSGKDPDGMPSLAAAELAQAQLELLRFRKTRDELLAVLNLESGDKSALKHLLALDRYDRVASTKKKRAARNLWPSIVQSTRRQ
jgi:hypothetical protein